MPIRMTALVRPLMFTHCIVALVVTAAVLYFESSMPGSYGQYKGKRSDILLSTVQILGSKSQNHSGGETGSYPGSRVSEPRSPSVVNQCRPDSKSMRECVTNDPFCEPMVQARTPPLQLASGMNISCGDQICSEYLTSTKNLRRCWSSKHGTEWRNRAVHCRFMNATGREPVALVSFPGSGNTWVRGLLEQVTGYCTGSVYCDLGLATMGFAGEGIRSGSVLVVKTHHVTPLWLRNSEQRPKFGSAVLLVRDVFDALKAEMNRRVTEEKNSGTQLWKSHVVSAGQNHFSEKNYSFQIFPHPDGILYTTATHYLQIIVHDAFILFTPAIKIFLEQQLE